MYRISKEYHFSASHVLEGLRPGHPCGRLHGHNYEVRLTLESEELDGHGFVIDYGDLDPFAHVIATTYDHRHLNDVLDGQPSAENLARTLYGIAKYRLGWLNVVSVEVKETKKTTAEYYEEGVVVWGEALRG